MLKIYKIIDRNKMSLLQCRWQHTGTTGNKWNCGNVIVFVISTCVLLFGFNLTDNTIRAIEETHTRGPIKLRAHLAKERDHIRQDVAHLDRQADKEHSNSSAKRHSPAYYNYIDQPGKLSIASKSNSSQLVRLSSVQTRQSAGKFDGLPSTSQRKHRINRRSHKSTTPFVHTNKFKSNSSDEEIETMRALIGVLDAANKKLVEKQEHKQRAKRVEPDHVKSMPKRADYSVTRANTQSSGNGTSSLVDLAARTTSPSKRTRFSSTGANRDELEDQEEQQQPRADPSEQVKSETTRDGNFARPSRAQSLDEKRRLVGESTTTTGEKKRKFKRKKSKDRRAPYNATQILDATRPPTILLDKSMKEPRPAAAAAVAAAASGATSPVCLNECTSDSHADQLVRPGFDNTPMSQNYIGQYQMAHPMGPLSGVTLDPLGGIMPAVSHHQMQDQPYAPHLILQGHRPIVAHDLLNARPPPSQHRAPHELHKFNQQHDNNVEDENLATRTPEQRTEMFVPQHEHELYKSRQVVPQLANNGIDYREYPGGVGGVGGGGGGGGGSQTMYESYPQVPASASPLNPAQLRAVQMLKRQQLLGYGPVGGYHQRHLDEQIQQDPYGYIKTTERPYDNRPEVMGQQHQVQGGASGDSKLAENQRPHLVEGEPLRHAPQGATINNDDPHTRAVNDDRLTSQYLNNRFGDMNQLAGGMVAPNPLLHLLDAAKNQQAATALAHERNRLNYELELRKRDEAMRRQHEANLEQQRVKAAAQEQERQQQQQQQQQQPHPHQPQQNQEQESNEQSAGQGEGGNADQQQQSNQDGDGGNEQQSPEDDNANQQDQEQPNEGSANNQQEQQQQQQQDDPDMKNFQNFAGDTDFTDLFPKGVLSEAEIKEMREQQAEQKQRQEQEEQEERDKQRAEADAEEEQQQQQQEPTSNESGGGNGGGHQQPAQTVEGGLNSGEQSASQKQSAQKNTTEPEVVTQQQQQQQQQQARSQPLTASSNSFTNASGVITRTPGTDTPPGLPSYMFKNVSAASQVTSTGDVNQTSAQKIRVSRDHSSSLLPRAPSPSQPLMVLDSEYHDRYMRPFLSSLVEINRQQLSRLDRTIDSEMVKPPQPPSYDSNSEWSHERKRRHDNDPNYGTASHQLVPVVEFDDLLEDYSDSTLIA